MSRFVLTAQLQLQAPTNTAQVVRQIQNQLNNVQVNLQVQGTAQATRQVNQVAQSINAANTAASNLGRTFAISVRRFTALAVATRAVSLFTNTLSKATEEAIQFERELIRISQVTGKSVKNLRELTKTITNLSAGLGVSSSSLIGVSRILSQAGFNAKQTEIALRTLAKTELAPTFDNITDTAEGAVAIFNQFRLGAEALEEQLGSINAVAGRFAVEAGDLIGAVRRVGGVFKASGGDLNELIALFTSVRATTRESAESIATGLRTIFTRIQRPKTIEFLKRFGVELVDLEGKFVGPFEATRRLSEALAGLEQGDITFIKIAEELGGFRQIGKVIPLLQQFSVAQEALNVAQKGGKSLTNDAASAQAALAVRITKVKEEFLALVRSITETSSFQLFANTALNLASSLIKLADALKPIIPLLTAVAGIRLAQGLGGFLTGFRGGIGSGRTFNQGGKVLKFARGGMVPGSGNRDTVPAMLQPGEFVVRKSSVNKMGASNLAAMNENGYAAGGLVIKNLKSEEFAGLFARPRGADSSGKPITIAGDAISKGSQALNTQVLAIQGAPKSYFIGGTDEENFTNKAASVLRRGIQDILTPIVGDPLAAQGAAPRVINSIGVSDIAGKIFEGVTKAAIQDFRDGSDKAGFDIPRFLNQSPQAGTSLPLLSNLFNNGNLMPNVDYDNKLTENYNNRASLLKKAVNAGYFGNNTILTQFRDSITTDQIIKSKKTSDISQKAQQRSIELKQARESARTKISNTEVLKLIDKRLTLQLQGLRTKFASGGVAKAPLVSRFAAGGSVGTDTVPALLTPGEFVVNKKSAQSIGYGSLNRMNKVGKYATGGTVGAFGAKKFASGGQASGGGNMFGNIGLQLTLVSSALQAMIPPVEENSNILTKLSSGFLSLLTQIGGAIFALQALNVTITKEVIGKGLKSLATTGKGGLGDIIGGFQKRTGVGGKIATGRRTGESFGEAFRFEKIKDFKNTLIQNKIGTLRSQAPSPLGIQSAQQRQGIANQIKALRSQRILSTQAPTSLTGRLGSFLGQKAVGGGLTGRAAGLAARGVSSIGGLGGIGGGAVGGALGGVAAAAGPALAVTAAVAAINSLVGSFRDLDGKLKEAIKAEDIAKAQSLAVSQSNAASLPIIGNLVGGFADLIGAGDSLANFFNFFGGQSASQIKTNIATQIQADKAQKALAKASEKSAKALQDFQNGTISATDVLRSTSEATKEAAELTKRTEEQVTANEKTGKSTGFDALRRNVGAYLGGGLLGMETASTRNDRIDKENKELKSKSKEAEENVLRAASPGLQVLQKQVAATSGSFDDFLNVVKATDPNLFDILIRQGSNDVAKSFENIAREAERTRNAFNALNLGFQKVSAVSGALSVGLENYLASQEAGFIPLENSVRLLEASVTSAAQAISDTDFKSALKDASDGLRDLGASEKSITKFEQNLSAINTAQKFYAKASADVKNKLVAEFQAGRGAKLSSEDQKKFFANAISNQLDGFGPEVKQRISDAIQGAEINPEDLNKIINEGDLSTLDKVLKDLGDTTLNQVIGPLKELAKYDKILVDLTKKRIESENNVIAAQRGVLEAQLEAQEIIAKYGGPALTPQLRSKNAIQQANLQAQSTGVSALRTGSGREINQRSSQIQNRLREIDDIQRKTADGDKRSTALRSGESGAQLDAEKQRLLALAKSDNETTKLLIKNKEEELKLIKEKNSLEKSSIDALISGDIEKFFDQQAAVGAQAAVASGSQTLQNAFGARALGAAAQETRRLQDSGVTELYGQQLGGPGGLTERSFGAALGAMGIQDQRMAQAAAGTTAEETRLEAEIRSLAETLPNLAQTQLQAAQQSLDVANIQMNAARIQLDAAKENVRARQMAQGGMVYASRGIFVPRGTDTVPAMLTPGEFVVRRQAVQRGNNLQILQAMNRGQSQSSSAAGSAVGMARGGVVKYYDDGGEAGGGVGFGLNPEIINKFSFSLDQFNQKLSANIDKLNNTTFNIKLDTTNINVNLTGTSFLEQLEKDIRSKLINFIGEELTTYGVGMNGKLQKQYGV